ncbi:hypothetical protein RISK_000703 [Rhodopirellula islandica]|uniref:Uncharacterized protein n=1 Tax=Rhodopirellula islandica TaxID=595434 RepID=A0A0J1BK71_RHOIS|nr:hypothetical protein RISK_000703 [Rhodopirellula islandica]
MSFRVVRVFRGVRFSGVAVRFRTTKGTKDTKRDRRSIAFAHGFRNEGEAVVDCFLEMKRRGQGCYHPFWSSAVCNLTSATMAAGDAQFEWFAIPLASLGLSMCEAVQR